MNFSYFIARKVAASGGLANNSLSGGGKGSFSRMIIRIAITAVALSMMVMVVASSLIAGFKEEISEKIFGFWGHINISDPNSSRSLTEVFPIDLQQDFYPSLEDIDQITYIKNEEVMGRLVEKEMQTKGGIRHIQAYAMFSGILSVNNQIEGLVLKGIGQDFDWDFMQQYIVEGEPLSWSDTIASNDIILSQHTSDLLDISLGDRISVFFVTPEFEQLERRFTVSAIYKTGLEEYDRQFALVDIRKIQQVLGWREDQVAGFEVFLDDIDDLDAMSDYIHFEAISTTLYADSIKKRMSNIFKWLELQDVNEWVIMGLMLLVGIINMVTALLILILERTNMIGTLKALGAGNWTIRRIFLYYAAYIVLLGLFWGNLLGLGFCWLQDTFGLITLDEANYYLSVAPVKINWIHILLLNIGTLAITLLFLIVPSFLVAHIDPVKAIRFK